MEELASCGCSPELQKHGCKRGGPTSSSSVLVPVTLQEHLLPFTLGMMRPPSCDPHHLTPTSLRSKNIIVISQELQAILAMSPHSETDQAPP